MENLYRQMLRGPQNAPGAELHSDTHVAGGESVFFVVGTDQELAFGIDCRSEKDEFDPQKASACAVPAAADSSSSLFLSSPSPFRQFVGCFGQRGTLVEASSRWALASILASAAAASPWSPNPSIHPSRAEGVSSAEHPGLPTCLILVYHRSAQHRRHATNLGPFEDSLRENEIAESSDRRRASSAEVARHGEGNEIPKRNTPRPAALLGSAFLQENDKATPIRTAEEQGQGALLQSSSQERLARELASLIQKEELRARAEGKRSCEVVDFAPDDNLSLADQFSLLSRASMFIGPHGAAFAFAAWVMQGGPGPGRHGQQEGGKTTGTATDVHGTGYDRRKKRCGFLVEILDMRYTGHRNVAALRGLQHIAYLDPRLSWGTEEFAFDIKRVQDDYKSWRETLESCWAGEGST